MEDRQLSTLQAEEKPEDQDVECPQTKIWLWDGDEYTQFESDFLNQIYPYTLNKRTLSKGVQFIFHFLDCSFHYWIEMKQLFPPEEGLLGIKDIKFIENMLREDDSDNWIAFRRWGLQFNNKKQFERHESLQTSFSPPKGEQIHSYSRGEDQFVVVQYLGNDKEFIPFKKRIEVLLLFYIDGVSFIDEETDNWVFYIIYKRIKGRNIFAGMLSKYIFRLSAVKERHRVSQVFILPSHQRAGHGKQILDLVYGISLKNERCFEITTQIPSFEFQCLRDYKELELLIKNGFVDLKQIFPMNDLEQIQEVRKNLLSKEVMRKIKESLKFPGHQIERLVNILIYNSLESNEMARAHFEEELRQRLIKNVSPFKTRTKLPHITICGQTPELKSFLIEKAKQDLMRNNDQIQENLLETLEGFRNTIRKLKKSKLLQ